MTERLPNPRYIGDGLYARHDGHQLIIETSDGIRVTNRIAIDADGMNAIRQYAAYALDFYSNGQQRIPTGCEKCGADLQDSRNPIKDAVHGEVYHIQQGDSNLEIRLCHNCSGILTQETLGAIIARRAAPAAAAEPEEDPT